MLLNAVQPSREETQVRETTRSSDKAPSSTLAASTETLGENGQHPSACAAPCAGWAARWLPRPSAIPAAIGIALLVLGAALAESGCALIDWCRPNGGA